MQKLVKTLTKKASNFAYKILLLHVFIPAPYTKIRISENKFLIIVIAFNNSEILKVQHHYLQKNVLDQFEYIIADNSNNKVVSEEIKLFCEKKNISYIRLPKNLLSNIRASGSHGMALNWCYRNIIRRYAPTYFGFLDHDIFPLIPTAVVSNIRNGFWGAIRTRSGWRYLWPGFSFFEYNHVRKYPFNFFPYHAGSDGLTFLDTGGANHSFLKKIVKDNVNEATSVLINLNTQKPFVLGDDSRKTFEIIDNAWLHLRQISWRIESSDKMSDRDAITALAMKYISTP